MSFPLSDLSTFQLSVVDYLVYAPRRPISFGLTSSSSYSVWHISSWIDHPTPILFWWCCSSSNHRCSYSVVLAFSLLLCPLCLHVPPAFCLLDFKSGWPLPSCFYIYSCFYLYSCFCNLLVFWVSLKRELAWFSQLFILLLDMTLVVKFGWNTVQSYNCEAWWVT